MKKNLILPCAAVSSRLILTLCWPDFCMSARICSAAGKSQGTHALTATFLFKPW